MSCRTFSQKPRTRGKSHHLSPPPPNNPQNSMFNNNVSQPHQQTSLLTRTNICGLVVGLEFKRQEEEDRQQQLAAAAARATTTRTTATATTTSKTMNKKKEPDGSESILLTFTSNEHPEWTQVRPRTWEWCMTILPISGFVQLFCQNACSVLSLLRI